MTTSHTPGPWCYQYEHGSYIIEAPSQTEPDKIQLVAELVSIEDTKLIAAAPDMLEALKRIAQMASRDGKDIYHDMRMIRNLAVRTALKAIGEAS